MPFLAAGIAHALGPSPALVVAAGLPTLASLSAVAFGVVEMTTSAGLAQWLGD
jgi:hypothetical protein